MLRGAEPDQHALALVEAEHRLVIQHVGHRPVRRRLARYGAGVGVAEITVDTQRTEQVIGRDLLVDHIVDLLTADRRIKGFTVLRLKPGHHRERRFLLRLRGPGAAVGTQLVYLAAEGNHFAIQFVERTQAKITVCQQIGDGGLTFVYAA